MFKVLINQCDKKIIEREFKKFEIITDAEIFKVLNAENDFDGIMFNVNNMSKFVDHIVEKSKLNNILIHTFNVQILNWIDDEVALRSFVLFSDGIFLNFFEQKRNFEKLNCMGPGEIVSDFDFNYIECSINNG